MDLSQQLQQALDNQSARIDVRSPGEFAVGSIPGFINLPILTDDERHSVGQCYKSEGQTAAIALGEKLTAPHRQARIMSWVEAARASPSGRAVVCCWRGGLRSQIAAACLRDEHVAATTIDGGYKALRALLLAQIAQSRPMLVLAGLTGSGKTALLHKLATAAKIDIEGLAEHRGSAFGGFADRPQPTAANFENRLGRELLLSPKHRLLIEDESQAIGAVFLPKAFRDQMSRSPVVFLEADLDTRMANIFDEYLLMPLAQGRDRQAILSELTASLDKIKRKLGGALHTELLNQIKAAFAISGPPDLADHRSWIQSLLVNYYDKSYWYAFKRQTRDVLFKGDFNQCQTWLANQYA